MALIFVGCEFESQPTQTASDSETRSLSKKGEKIKIELITFTGDLAGSQVVEGCCPNAGPFPEFTMTLSGSIPAGTYDGNIFMNKVGGGKNKYYMVQFWWTEIDNYFIEVRGGVFQEDKKTKTLTAKFTDATCKIWINDVLTPTVTVNFILTRAPQ
jgi:hypothetical protein